MKGQRGIFERPKGSQVWWIRYADATGRERREKAGTKSAARQLYTKRKAHALEGRKLPEKLRARTILFNELLDDAVEYNEHRAGSSGKLRSRRVDLLRDGMGSMAADAITPQVISRWRAKASKENSWAPATANRYKALISLAFRLGVENGKCSSNPARAVRRLREENERVRYLSQEEEERLREAIAELCPERAADLDVALNTGMRQAEQYKLTWRDVKLLDRRTTVGKTKNGTRRHLPLNDAALAAFQSLHLESNGQERVFLNIARTAPLENPRYWWDGVVRQAQLVDFHWHDLRHTFASRCVMRGVDIRTLQQLLGHKSLQMVVRYTHLSQCHELAAVQRLCESPVVDGGTGTTTGTD